MTSSRARATGPRRKQITPRSRLPVLQGDGLAVLPVVLEDEKEVVPTMEPEDVQEVHLQQALENPTTVHKKDVTIPIPKADGVVVGFDEYYPHVWHDPTTMTRSSYVPEECITGALAGDGGLYYMDEYDNEWLMKHNAAAAAAAADPSTSSFASTSSSPLRRVLKGKGKEREKDPDACPGQPCPISEDEFELVMAFFERRCVREHVFLDFEFRPGNIPGFSEFEADFENVSAKDFPSFIIPSWVPPPAQLVRMARAVYQHWMTRRIQRRGGRVHPVAEINEDHVQSKDDAYLCFRPRELRALRKPRKGEQPSLQTIRTPLERMQKMLEKSMELASLIVQREEGKRLGLRALRDVMEGRFRVVDLKRSFSSLDIPADDHALLLERPRKKARSSPPVQAPPPAPVPATISPAKVSAPRPSRQTRQRTSVSPMPPVVSSATPEPAPPSRRALEELRQQQQAIAADVEKAMASRRTEDEGWQDALDVPVQKPHVSQPEAHFRPVAGSKRAMRTRVGRGGRIVLDRVPLPQFPIVSFAANYADIPRWSLDRDGPLPTDVDDGPRMFVDDFDPRYMFVRSAMLTDKDKLTQLTWFRIEVVKPPSQSQAQSQPAAAPVQQPPILMSDRQIRISSQARREQSTPRPSPPAVVAPPSLQTPAIRPTASPTTVAPPVVPSSPAVAPLPDTTRPATPVPVNSPIRPPSVAPVAVATAARTPTPVQHPAPQPGQPVLRPVANVPRGAMMGTPKLYATALPVANGHAGAAMMGPSAPTPAMAQNGILQPHPNMHGMFIQQPRPVSRAGPTPNGFPAGMMMSNGAGPSSDAQGMSRVPSPARPRTAMSVHGVPLTAANMQHMNGSPMMVSQPMQANPGYAVQMPSGIQYSYQPTMVPSQHPTQNHLEPGLAHRIHNAFAPQQMQQQLQQQQQQQQHHHQMRQQQQHQQQQHLQHQVAQQQQQQQQQHASQLQQRVAYAPGMPGHPAGMNMAMPNGSLKVAANRASQAVHYTHYMYQQQQQQQQMAAAAAGNGMMGAMPAMGMTATMLNGAGAPQMVMVHPAQPLGQRLVSAPNGQLLYVPVAAPQQQQQQPTPGSSKSTANGTPPVPAH